VMLAVLVAQWVKQSRIEAARIDRELDREEERLRSAA
jgi:putative membrane protein